MSRLRDYNTKIRLTIKQAMCLTEVLASDTIKFICLFGGSRSGKTFFAFWCVVMRAILYPGSYHLVFRKTLSSLRIGMINQTMPAIWRLFANLNDNQHPFDVRMSNGKAFVTWNKSENLLTFWNGSKIFFYGATATAGDEDSMTKILSSEYFTILVEEGNESEYKVIEKLFTRLTQVVFNAAGKKGKPKFLTTLNPTTFDSWDFAMFQDKVNPSSHEPLNAELYASVHFTPEDNLEHLSDDYIATLQSLSPRDRQRFLAGEYGETFEGEIFKQLNWIDIPDWSVFERICIYVDPSYKSGVKNDYKAVATVGVCQGDYYVLDINAAQTTTYGMFELIHTAQSYAEAHLQNLKGRRAMVETWIENQGLADDFAKALDEYTAKNQCAIPFIKDNTNKGDKFMRIETLLVPLNDNYKLKFSNAIKNKPISKQVNVQFLNFAKNMPKDIHDDIPDAVHGAVMKLSAQKVTIKQGDIYMKNTTYGYN